MPEFAIANNYSFGTTPSVLTELTDVELALITPVKTFGYCFAWGVGLRPKDRSLHQDISLHQPAGTKYNARYDRSQARLLAE